MPDPEISRLLGTEPPNPEFVANTRRLLSDAWSQPIDDIETTDTDTDTDTDDVGMGTPDAEPQQPHIRAATHVTQPPAAPRAAQGRGPHDSRKWWILSSAAAVVALGALGVVLIVARPSSPIADPSATTRPNTTPTSTQVTTSPVSSSIDPSTSSEGTKPTSIPPTWPDDPTVAAMTDGPTADLTNYAQAPVPDWAAANPSAPVADYPADGVYAANYYEIIDAPNGSDEDATVSFDLDQIFVGQACLDNSVEGPNAGMICTTDDPAYPDGPPIGWASHADSPSSSYAGMMTEAVGSSDQLSIIATYEVSDSLVTYEVPFDEFVRGLRGDEVTNMYGFEFRLLVQAGKVTGIVSLADARNQINYAD